MKFLTLTTSLSIIVSINALPTSFGFWKNWFNLGEELAQEVIMDDISDQFINNDENENNNNDNKLMVLLMKLFIIHYQKLILNLYKV